MKHSPFRVPAILIGVLLLAAAVGPSPAAASGAIWRVTETGLASGPCGSTWPTACSLQYSLATAASGDQLWVKAGVYRPTTDTAQVLVSFNIRSGISLYGGFAGTETLWTKRNPAVNLTILSGDIAGDDDGGSDSNHIDETWADIVEPNSRHVLYLDGSSTSITTNTVIDGVIITGGNAVGGTTPHQTGGGMLCLADGATAQCTPTISNVTFIGNNASYGGAMENLATTGGNASPIITNVAFVGNHGYFVGAMHNKGWESTSSPVLTNVTFSGNHAYYDGAAMTNEAWMGGTSSPTLQNVTFNGNVAENGDGGAVYNYDADAPSTCVAQFVNTILWGNTASGTPSEVYNNGAVPTFTNSIIKGSGGSAAWTGPGTDLGGNLDADPLLNALANTGGSTPTMTLQGGSSAIDSGSGTGAPATDQRGIVRPQDGDGDGTATPDMGATESRYGTKTFKSQGATDGWVLESGETTGVGGTKNSAGTTLRVGDDINRKQYVSILSFNTATLPDNADPFDVTLMVKRAGTAVGDPFGVLGKIAADIMQGPFGLNALELTDFQAAAQHDIVTMYADLPLSGNWYSGALNGDGLEHINLVGLTQFRLRFEIEDNDDAIANYMKFYSGNHATATYRPKLVVKYNLP